MIFPMIGSQVLLKQLNFIDKVFAPLGFRGKNIFLLEILVLFPQFIYLLIILGYGLF